MELRAELLRAAERRIAAEGLKALKAREIAAEVGCALGQIYNIYDDLDSLILAVNACTLDELDEWLQSASSTAAAATAASPSAVMVAQAHAYLDFASENRNRWRAMFEHRLGREPPDWYREQQARLFGHLDRPLRSLLPDLPPAERALLGRSIFSAVHGMVWLGIGEKLGHQPYQELHDQLERVVLAIARGLQSS